MNPVKNLVNGGIDYDAMKKSVRKHKSALTRAKNTGDPHQVVAAVDRAFGEWDEAGHPYPDSWHTWNIAKRDAQFQIARDQNFNDRRL